MLILLSTILCQLLAISRANIEWATSPSVLPSTTGREGMGVAYYNDSFWLLGGDDGALSDFADITRYDPVNDAFTVILPAISSDYISSSSQGWTQIQNTFYAYATLRYQDVLYAELFYFNLDTQTYNNPIAITPYVIPSSPALYDSCMSSYADTYVLVLGGYNADNATVGDTMHIFNIITEQWTLGPLMPQKRSLFSCVIQNDLLYIIGGTNTVDTLYIDTVSTLDISDITNVASVSWDTLSNTLSVGRHTLRAVSYPNDSVIFVMGGIASTGTSYVVDRIHTDTENIYADTSLPTAVHSQGIMNINDKIYMFGGNDGSNMLRDVLIGSVFPSTEPDTSKVSEKYATVDVVYNIKGAFDDDGKILEDHLLVCGETKSYIDVGIDADHTSNWWFMWETTGDVLAVTVSVLGNHNEWLYFVYDADEDAAEGLLTMSSLVEICYKCGLESSTNVIDIDWNTKDSDFPRGTYWIGADGDFTVTVKCDKKEPGFKVTAAEISIIVIVFSVFICCVFLCLFYSMLSNRKWKVYREDGQHQEVDVPLLPDFKGKVTSMKGKVSTGIQLQAIAASDQDDDKDDADPDLPIESVDLTAYTEVIDSMVDNEEGLDVYQILAFRLKYWTDPPPYACRFSAIQISAFVACVVAALQTYGVTVTLISVFDAYFYNEDGSTRSEAGCEWQSASWSDDGVYKVLAFLWSVVISASVAIYAQATMANGMNALIAEDLATKKLMILDEIVDTRVLQIGVMVNFYTLTMAIIGSFFLIYASEGGEDALDMILNAVALYFMLELDDMLVATKDYQDLGKHIAFVKGISSETWESKLVGDSSCDELLFFKCGSFYRYLTSVIIALSSFTMPFAILICF